MPQPAAKMEVRKIISARFPDNISAVDKQKLEDHWNQKAKEREEAIAKETRIPTEATLTLRYQLRKFGKHWNAYVTNEKGKYVPLLPSPSLLFSAINALTDYMSDEALKI